MDVRSYVGFLKALCVVGLAAVCALVGARLLQDTASRSYALEAWLSSSTDSNAQVYFDTGTGFNEAQSVRSALLANTHLVPYLFPLPPGTYRSLRFDPLDSAGSVVVRSMRIIDTRRQFSHPILPTELVPAHEIKSVRIVGPDLEIKTEPNARDPYLTIAFIPPLTLPVNEGIFGNQLLVISFAGIAALVLTLALAGPALLRRTSLFQDVQTASSNLVANSKGSALRNAQMWFLVLILAAEFYFFDSFRAKWNAHLYPLWNDQIQYLSESYVGFEYARVHGFLSGLLQTLTNRSAQGTLHDFAALFIFLAAGVSRRAALSLNIFTLIAWQLALYLCLARDARFRSASLAAAMLPICLSGLWISDPGSTIDFRLDHFAMCAFGICTSIAIRTHGFRSRPWSLLFGIAVGVTLVTRFLTGTYFIVILFAFVCWLLMGEERSTRVLNLVISVGVAFLIAAPIFWVNRAVVWNYYWIGHYVGPESAIRNQNFGVLRSLSYIFGHFFNDYVGSLFLWLVGIGTASVLAAAALRRSNVEWRSLREDFVIGAAFFLAPLIILTLHAQKSPVVLSIMAPGFILMVASLWARFSKGEAVLGGAVAAVIVSVGGAYFVGRQVTFPYSAAFLASSEQARTVSDYVFERTKSQRTRAIRVAADYNTNALDAQVMRMLCYERHHEWLDFEMTLPTGISEPSDSDVFERLAKSDFVFITEDGPKGQWPFDQKLTELRPQIHAWCEANLHFVERYLFFGRQIALYESNIGLSRKQ